MLEKLCPNCGEWVGLGGRGGTYSFDLHQEGRQCHRAGELKMLSRAEETHPRRFIPEPVSGHYPHRISESSPVQAISPYPNIPMATTSPTFSPLVSLPPLILPETPRPPPVTPETMELIPPFAPLLPCIPTSLPPIAQLLEQAPLITSNTGFPTATTVPCRGVRLKWEYGPSSKTYPFQYHDTDNLPWSVTTRRPPDPDVIHIQAFSCTLWHNASTEACSECLKVPSSDKFQSLVFKASTDPAPTMPWGYLSWKQLLKRLKEKTDECQQYYKKVSSTSPQRPWC